MKRKVIAGVLASAMAMSMAAGTGMTAAAEEASTQGTNTFVDGGTEMSFWTFQELHVGFWTSMADVWNEHMMVISPNDVVPCTFAGYYDKIISRLGTNGTVYKAASDTLVNTVSSIDNMRQQISGVSSDEELSNMVKYQSAYNAASRYITVISQMTELIVGLI